MNLWDHLTFMETARRCAGTASESRYSYGVLGSRGFPNVVLEAMSASLPVITTPAGGAGHFLSARRGAKA